MSTGLRTAIDMANSDSNNLVTIGGFSTASLDVAAPASYSRKYVGAAASGTVLYTPTAQGGNLSWAVGDTVAPKYLPKRSYSC